MRKGTVKRKGRRTSRKVMGRKSKRISRERVSRKSKRVSRKRKSKRVSRKKKSRQRRKRRTQRGGMRSTGAIVAAGVLIAGTIAAIVAMIVHRRKQQSAPEPATALPGQQSASKLTKPVISPETFVAPPSVPNWTPAYQESLDAWDDIETEEDTKEWVKTYDPQ